MVVWKSLKVVQHRIKSESNAKSNQFRIGPSRRERSTCLYNIFSQLAAAAAHLFQYERNVQSVLKSWMKIARTVDTFFCPPAAFALFFNFYYSLPYRLFLQRVVKKKIPIGWKWICEMSRKKKRWAAAAVIHFW